MSNYRSPFLSDVHRVDPGGGEPVPDPADLHVGADQAVQGEEDRRAAAAHLRHRRRGLPEHAHAWVHHEFQFHE